MSESKYMNTKAVNTYEWCPDNTQKNSATNRKHWVNSYLDWLPNWRSSDTNFTPPVPPLFVFFASEVQWSRG